MVVIPGINCPNFKCVKAHWEKAIALKPRAVQIDVSDGVFAPVESWNNPSELAALIGRNSKVIAEVHLMVAEPDKVFEDWIRAGAKRIVVHLESEGDFASLRDKAAALGAEVVWGIEMKTSLEALDKYLGEAPDSAVQLLDVSPGFSGQKFNPVVLEKIKFLRGKWPRVRIRVDGGMNPETVEQAKAAGADAVVAVSYIWESGSPEKAYRSLTKI